MQCSHVGRGWSAIRSSFRTSCRSRPPLRRQKSGVNPTVSSAIAFTSTFCSTWLNKASKYLGLPTSQECPPHKRTLHWCRAAGSCRSCRCVRSGSGLGSTGRPGQVFFNIWAIGEPTNGAYLLMSVLAIHSRHVALDVRNSLNRVTGPATCGAERPSASGPKQRKPTSLTAFGALQASRRARHAFCRAGGATPMPAARVV
jgi:hypothetical protein